MNALLRVGLCLVAFTGSSALALRDLVQYRSTAERIEAAARTYLASLDAEQRAQAVLSFDDPYRTDWHYIPRSRRGLRIDEMNDEQRRLLHGLLRSALSSQGYLKVTSIMGLEETLGAMERAAGGDGTLRDRGAYTVTFFGSPEDRPWAWRFEGHHVSLNLLTGEDGSVAVTPEFLGANPATVSTGPDAGLEILSKEEELGFRLLHALSDVQRAEAIIDVAGRGDILLTPGTNIDALGQPVGLPASRMTAEQLHIFGDLVSLYAHNFDTELAQPLLERLGSADPEQVFFAWVGGVTRAEPHYYRIHGPGWVIELDNSRPGANHVHTVWRDAENDFGAAALERHLRESHLEH